jgi:hypothetical protein
VSVASSVVVDLDGEHAVVGGSKVVVVRVNPDDFEPANHDLTYVQIGGAAGPVLRSLRFGERSLAVSMALRNDNPSGTLAEIVTRLATCRDGDHEANIVSALALRLAGAGETDLPFDETVRVASRNIGVAPDRIANVDACFVDRTAATAAGSRGGEWRRIVFVDDREQDVEAIVAELADSLLERARQDIVKAAELAAPIEGDANADMLPPSNGDAPDHIGNSVADSNRLARSGIAIDTGPLDRGSAARELTDGLAAPGLRNNMRRNARLGATAFGIFSPVEPVPKASGQIVDAHRSEREGRVSLVDPIPARHNDQPASSTTIDASEGAPETIVLSNPGTAQAEIASRDGLGLAGRQDGEREPAVGTANRESSRPVAGNGASGSSSGRGGFATAPSNGLVAARNSLATDELMRRPATLATDGAVIEDQSHPMARRPTADFDLEDVADDLALMLQHEADLRGIDP